MRRSALAVVALLLLGLRLPAAEVMHYWDFDSLQDDYPVDTIGGVVTSPVGTPDFSIHKTYGEAYPGGGNSLNSTLGTPDYLLAEVFDEGFGSATALDLGVADFAFSYWSYDASDVDGDARGPRVFDALNNTDVGIQLASNLQGIFNYRMDDDAGNVIISNTILGDVTQPDGEWVHVTVNVSRTGGEAEIFFDAVSQGSYDISVLTSDIAPGQDMQIGVINGGTTVGAAQQCGLDDLAFYSGNLSAAEIAGLASAGLVPTDITEGPQLPFEITSFLIAENGEVTMTWNSRPNVLYAIDMSTTLEPKWLELLDEVESEGAMTSFSFTPKDPPPAMCWRVRVLE